MLIVGLKFLIVGLKQNKWGSVQIVGYTMSV
jgi:hypothetical protein